MPIPEKFYNEDGEERQLDRLCAEAPGWAANRIRALHEQADSHRAKIDFMKNQIADLLAYIKKLKKSHRGTEARRKTVGGEGW